MLDEEAIALSLTSASGGSAVGLGRWYSVRRLTKQLPGRYHVDDATCLERLPASAYG